MSDPIVTMTNWQYWCRWAAAGVIMLILARLFLVEPILTALRDLKR